jgi:putative oxidoreductase
VSFLRNPVVQLVLRVALGGFFVYASLDKIANPAAFAKIVYQWQVVGPVPSNLVAIVLPWVELLSGLALIVGLWKREAALVVALMLVMFLGAAASVLARGIDVENCGCTSVSKSAEPSFFKGVGWFLVGRNLLMLASAVVLIAAPPRAEEKGAMAAQPV